MITIDFKNAVDESVLNKYASKINSLHKSFHNKSLEGSEHSAWVDLPKSIDRKVFKEIHKYFRFLISKAVKVLVVVANNEANIAIKGAIDFIKGNFDTPSQKKIEVIFVGNNLSATDLAQKLKYVEARRFAINYISGFGNNIESSLAFKLFYNQLCYKESPARADELVFVATYLNRGSLIKNAERHKWKILPIKSNIGENFAIFTPYYLFAMYCAGLNIRQICEGAKEAYYDCSKEFRKNDAYKYAAARHLLAQKYPAELFASFEPYFDSFNLWWRQLFANSENKMNRGLFPLTAVFGNDINIIGQPLQFGLKICFETFFTIDIPKYDLKILANSNNSDSDIKTVQDLNNKSIDALKQAHHGINKIPFINISCYTNDEKNLGYLFYFFQRAAVMSAYLFGVNPFKKEAIQIYKANLLKNLRDKQQ